MSAARRVLLLTLSNAPPAWSGISCCKVPLRALLSAAPIPDPKIERNRKRVKLEGEAPSPLDPKTAFRFLPSRLAVDAETPVLPPELKEVVPGHLVSEYDPA